MELNEYQRKAMSTCMSTCDNYTYMMNNLIAEVGEFAGKVAKMVRKGQLEVKDGDLCPKVSFAEWAYMNGELMKEAGDILWQLAGLCHVMGWEMDEVAVGNLDKLASRKDRGVICGDGDNR